MELGIADFFAFGEFLEASGIADLGAGGSPVGTFLEAVAGIGAAFVFHCSARIAHLARRVTLRIRFRGRIAISAAGTAHAFLIALVIRAALIGVADFPSLTGQAVAKLLAGADIVGLTAFVITRAVRTGSLRILRNLTACHLIAVVLAPGVGVDAVFDIRTVFGTGLALDISGGTAFMGVAALFADVFRQKLLIAETQIAVIGNKMNGGQFDKRGRNRPLRNCGGLRP